MRVLFAVLLAIFLASTPASADELRPAYIALEQHAPGKWDLQIVAPLRETGSYGDLGVVLPENCQSLGAGRPRFDGPTVTIRSRLLCDGPLAGQPVGISDLAGSSEVFLKVAPLGEDEDVYRLTISQKQVTLGDQDEAGRSFADYLLMGIEHILEGWDHLLFVIALVLLVRRTRRIVATITAFTLAHSFTLIATTLDLVSVPSRPVEALIALSIALVAIEVIKSREDRPTLMMRAPWIVAFLFGLVHGFGFAGALRDIGLPPGDVPLVLLAFNLGIEIGQLFIIAVVVTLRGAIAKFAPAMVKPAVTISAYLIGIVSCYWLIDRL